MARDRHFFCNLLVPRYYIVSMKSKLYTKVGTRYKEVGETFSGFPADGVWLVTNGRKSSECILQINDIPTIPSTALLYRASMKDRILKSIQQRMIVPQKGGYHGYADIHLSPNDLAKIACDAVAEILEEECAKQNVSVCLENEE